MGRFINYFKKKRPDELDQTTFLRNDIDDNEHRDVIVTVIVSNGKDTGVAGYIPGYLIKELDNVLEKISNHIDGARKE